MTFKVTSYSMKVTRNCYITHAMTRDVQRHLTLVHAHTHIHTYTCMRTYTYTYTCARTYTYTYTSAHILIHSGTYMNTYTPTSSKSCQHNNSIASRILNGTCHMSLYGDMYIVHVTIQRHLPSIQNILQFNFVLLNNLNN